MLDKRLLVLAGGFGTRLRTVVADRPKPLAPVGPAPFLKILLEQWIGQGARDFVFLLHHQADRIIALLEELETTLLRDSRVAFLIEPAPLGTGGAVAHAVEQLHLSETLLVANADTWLGAGLVELADTPAPALAMVEVPDTSRYGGLTVDEEGCVTAFREKQDSRGAGWINAGLYHLRVDSFQHWNGRPFSLERDLFPRLAAGHHLRAVPLRTDFIDIGIPEDYRRFSSWIEAGRTHPL